MKTEEMIIVLKQLCDANGFELLTESPKENDKFFVVKKKDIWEGVEFVEYDKPNLTSGQSIFKIDRIENQYIYFHGGYFFKSEGKPSTESAYIEQLKRIAFEKFGEIKYGDRFKRDFGIGTIGDYDKKGFNYVKNQDSFAYDGIIIYQQGKWAEKLPERVKVEFDGWKWGNNLNEVHICFKINKFETVKDKDDLFEYLTKHLENYLNDTNNNQD